MLDKLKNLSQGFAQKVADKATEVNSKVSQKAKANEDEKYVVGLDIGTEFVKVLIGRVKDDTIEIVGVGRSHQQLSDMQAGAIADISKLASASAPLLSVSLASW